MAVNQPPRVYLDQNVWIALSKAHYGRDDTGKYETPLKAIVAASNADLIRVPLSFVHMMEVCASGDMERRKRLASFMIKVSRQYAIFPCTKVWCEEALEVAARWLGVDIQWVNPELFVQQGLWYAFGIAPIFKGGHSDEIALIENAIRSDEMAVKMLSEWMASDLGRKLRAKSEVEAAFLDDIRHRQLQSQGAEGKRRENTLMIARQMLLPIAEAECQKFGIQPAKLHEKIKSEDDLIAFAHDVPSFDVLLTLVLARDEEAQRKIDRNDIRDMAFLATAIPYCDIVVAERYFGNLAKRTGLDRKYGCTILTNATELMNVLPQPVLFQPPAVGNA
ncbi:MAG: hypothetical protein FWD61_07585 [Phycisphaerales bacterium]|nr:hypothetical protein [Phycisphaerales bacterium]